MTYSGRSGGRLVHLRVMNRRDAQTLFALIILSVIGTVAAAVLHSVWVSIALVGVFISWSLRLYIDSRRRDH